ncbi:MAG: hypothetical protein R3272_02755 [Candidatus Promineifilaceae bacterium]|nr:hypothetical protein [Candidatus Promineifilaceae bacterium]
MKKREWIDLLAGHAEQLHDYSNGDWTDSRMLSHELASLLRLAYQISQALVPVPVEQQFKRQLHDRLLYEPAVVIGASRSMVTGSRRVRRWLALGSALSLAGLWFLWRRQRDELTPAPA